MKEELIALRQEVQRDRLALQATINDGFDRVIDQLADHGSRLNAVEKNQKMINWGLGTAISAAFAALGAWVTGR